MLFINSNSYTHNYFTNDKLNDKLPEFGALMQSLTNKSLY